MNIYITKWALVPKVIIMMMFFIAHKSHGDEKGFDTQTLGQLGFSKDVAEFFDKARFLPGRQRVTLEVNAAERYQEDILFNERGELCLDQALADVLNLSPGALLTSCAELPALWPEARVEYFPGSFRLALTLPERAFDKEKRRGELRGGHAALLSYDMYANQWRSRSGKNETFQAMLTPGINVKNWVIRNRSNYNHSEAGSRLDMMETSATREIAAWSSRLQLGEFGAAGTFSSGLPISGAQLYSGQTGAEGVRLAVPIEGIAQTQSTVEVKQRGQTVYRSLVPAGPFSLNQLGGAVGGVETEVTVTGADGQQQRFSVTPISGAATGRESSYQFGVGRYRSYSGSGAGMPLLLLGEKHWQPAARKNMGLGGLLASRYKNVSWRWGMSTEGGDWFSLGGVYARGRRRGVQVDAQGQLALGRNVSLSVFSQWHSRGYRGADEVLSGYDPDDPSHPRMANSVSLSWGSAEWGALSYGMSREHYYRDRRSVSHFLSYGKRVGEVSLNLSLRSSDYDKAALYAGISLPLGGGSWQTRMQSRRNNQFALGSSWQGNVANGLYSRLEMNRESDGEYGIGGSLSGDTAYSRLALSGAQTGGGNTSLSLGASGALGVANGAWVTSPYPAGDSLAVVEVPGRSGVKINTSGSGGITDLSGTALLAALPAHQSLALNVDTSRLPLNVRLDSTSAELTLAYGSVASRQFRATEVRQLLLTVRDTSGNTLPLGASVLDEEGNFMGTLVGEGNLLLSNDDIGKTLRIRRANQDECQLSYAVPAHFDANMLYEEGEAVCQNLTQRSLEVTAG